MEPLQIGLTGSRTREALFAAKYDWLLRWALHFAQGDHATAEDLVQDAFIRFALAETELRTAENIEALLYTYLKYAHLAHLRRLQRYPHEPLSIAEFDSLHLGLRETRGTDPIEVQDTLRRIVAYACWRKESAKSASVLILRFFHGYYHEEITRVARMTPKSVDTSLWEAKEETRLYLSDPGRLRVMRQTEPPVVMPRHVAVPSEQIIEELRRTIFAACRTECLPTNVLLERYRTQPVRPIERDTLAHVVSCERCLGLVSEFRNGAPPSDRSPEESAGADRRSRRGPRKDGPASGNKVRQALRIARERAREVYEHRPRRLTVAVNGNVIASQGVNSPWTRQEIALSAGTKAEFIEVMSEQGVCLLAMRVASEPPDSLPEIRHETELSLGRRIEVRLQFTSVGPLVEVTYHDPSPAADAEPVPEVETVNMDAGAEKEDINNEPLSLGGSPTLAPSSSLWPRLLARMAPPDINPVYAATALVSLAILLLAVYWSGRSKPTANGVLARAIAAHTEGTRVADPGVVRQRVRIRTPERIVDRSIYRDLQGRRHRKAEKLSIEDTQLKTQLARADVNWDEPLSPVDYKAWREGQQVTKDRVTRSADGLLTLTSDVSGGEVEREALTLRERDFYPVGRSVTFRNAGTIEVAELDYSVSPWGPPNESLFEPLPPRAFSVPARSPASLPIPLQARLPAAPVALPPIAKADLDEAELKVRLVLNQLHADTDERIQLSRDPTDIQVNGIVDGWQRKQQLQTGLAAISHVMPSISTFQEMQTRQENQTGSSSAAAVDTIHEFRQPGQPSLLETYLKEKGWTLEKITELSWQLLDSSIAVSNEGKSIADLASRFGTDDSLSPAARSALSQLLANHRATLLFELQREEELLTRATPQRKSAGPVTSVNEVALADAAGENRVLCEELTKANPNVEPNRSAEAKIAELQASVNQTRAATQRLTAPVLNATASNTTSGEAAP